MAILATICEKIIKKGKMKVAAPFDAYPVSAKKHSHEKERIGSRRARATKDVQRQCQKLTRVAQKVHLGGIPGQTHF